MTSPRPVGLTESPPGSLGRPQAAKHRWPPQTNDSDGGASDVQTVVPTLLVILGLASWADHGFAVSLQRAARPGIASTTVDPDKNIMVVSGRPSAEGSAVVALGHRVLKVQSHSDNEVVVELPAGLAPVWGVLGLGGSITTTPCTPTHVGPPPIWGMSLTSSSRTLPLAKKGPLKFLYLPVS
jgi:hypothetical protein